jgi:hypothetical protein
MLRLLLLVSACMDPILIQPDANLTLPDALTPIGSAADLDRDLAHTLGLYNDLRHLAVFPHAKQLRQIGSGLATLGFYAIDVGQSVLDQQSQPWMPLAANTLDQCRDAVPADTAEILAYGHDDVGNPPDPPMLPLWLPVPSHLGNYPSKGCGDPRAADNADLCLFGRLALQRQPADLIVVVPGLLHSNAHHYVRLAAAVLYSLGFSVLTLDMRDHGATFRARPDVPSTLGVLEGQDLVAVADLLLDGNRNHCRNQIQKVGILGYSAGASFALRAFVADRARPRAQWSLGAGVLAVAPILDAADTLARMSALDADGKPAKFFLGSAVMQERGEDSAVNVRATAYYFMELMRIREETRRHFGPPYDLPPLARIDPERYVRWCVAKYGNLERPDDVLQPQRLAADFTALAPTAAGAPFAAVIASSDDPVVGSLPRDRLVAALPKSLAFDAAGRLANTPPVGVYGARFGGHGAFTILSSPLSRHFLRAYFCASGSGCAAAKWPQYPRN